jgi:predicted alpha/beta superfamily hydrolase
MNENVSNDPSLDEISKDENNYDEQTVKLWIDWISEKTKNCYELNELYKLAAATMISLDRDTGLAVLFSFDYFEDFHSLLSIYFKDIEDNLEMTAPYERLWNRLVKK